MQAVPNNWNDVFAIDHKTEFKAVINEITYTYSQIKSAQITKSMMDKLTLGQATSAMLDMVFRPQGTIPTAAKIECYVRLANYEPTTAITDEASNIIKTDDGYVLASAYSVITDWIPFGTFYIDTRETAANGLMTITAYDRMLAAEQSFPSTAGSMTMSAATAYIAAAIGVDVDSRNQIAPYSIDSPVGLYTMREVLSGIAAASGGNFVITENNKLRLIRIASPSISENMRVASCDVLSDVKTIGKVTLYPDTETQYSSGTSGYEIQADCIYATQAICDYVKSLLSGATYLPYSAGTAILNPALELGDSVKPNGNQSILASAVFTIGVSMSANIEAPIDAEVNHEYPYQSRTKEERKLATSQSRIEKTTEEIRLSVEGKADADDVQTAIDLNLNELSLSYTAGENGASITLSKEGVSITGDVKVGSIDASKISVKNLDAAEITTGTLSAIDIVGCTIYATQSKEDYAKMTSTGLEVYTDGSYKMGFYVDGTYPTLELGNTTPAYVQKLYENSAHKMWIGNATGRDGIMIDFTNHTITKIKNGVETTL